MSGAAAISSSRVGKSTRTASEFGSADRFVGTTANQFLRTLSDGDPHAVLSPTPGSASASLRARLNPTRWGLPVRRGLDAIQLRILTALCHQLVVSAVFHQLRAVEDDDEIGHAHGGKPMRYEN